MAKEISKQLRSLISGSTLQLCANLVATVGATWYLSAYDRGLMVLALSIASVAAILGTAGLGNILRSTLPTLSPNESNELKSRYSLLALVTLVFWTLVALLFVTIFGRFFSERLTDIGFLLVLVLSLTQQMLALIVTDAHYAEGKFKRGVAWTTGAAFVGLILVGVAIASKQNVVALTLMQVGGSLAVTLCSVASSYRGKIIVKPSFAGSIRKCWSMLFDGYQSLGISLSIILLSRIDRLILGALTSPALVAIYALAVSIVEPARVVANSYGQVMLRMVSQRQSWPILRRLFARGLALSMALLLILNMVGMLLIPRVFAEEYAHSTSLLPLLGLVELAMAVVVISSMAVVGAGKYKFMFNIGLFTSAAGSLLMFVGANVAAAYGLGIGRGVALFAIGMLITVEVRRTVRAYTRP